MACPDTDGDDIDADSPLWPVRAAAGRLTAATADAGVDGVLHRLHLDARDTGVTQATAEALLERGDVYGLRAVLRALARAQDMGTADQLGAAIDCDPHGWTEAGDDRRIHELRELTSDEDAGVRAESAAVLGSLRPSDLCDEASFTSALPSATCTWIEENRSPDGCS
ncbi:hypothetical protein [Streptomyces sp. NPDC051286]|uniref:hypothetical protein n=1 Tax=Streptomyces sp. NPDC051286 TaxID=3365647 RepID=UPI0037BA8BC0